MLELYNRALAGSYLGYIYLNTLSPPTKLKQTFTPALLEEANILAEMLNTILPLTPISNLPLDLKVNKKSLKQVTLVKVNKNFIRFANSLSNPVHKLWYRLFIALFSSLPDVMLVGIKLGGGNSFEILSHSPYGMLGKISFLNLINCFIGLSSLSSLPLPLSNIIYLSTDRVVVALPSGIYNYKNAKIEFANKFFVEKRFSTLQIQKVTLNVSNLKSFKAFLDQLEEMLINLSNVKEIVPGIKPLKFSCNLCECCNKFPARENKIFCTFCQQDIIEGEKISNSLFINPVTLYNIKNLETLFTTRVSKFFTNRITPFSVSAYYIPVEEWDYLWFKKFPYKLPAGDKKNRESFTKRLYANFKALSPSSIFYRHPVLYALIRFNCLTSYIECFLNREELQILLSSKKNIGAFWLSSKLLLLEGEDVEIFEFIYEIAQKEDKNIESIEVLPSFDEIMNLDLNYVGIKIWDKIIHFKDFVILYEYSSKLINRKDIEALIKLLSLRFNKEESYIEIHLPYKHLLSQDSQNLILENLDFLWKLLKFKRIC